MPSEMGRLKYILFEIYLFFCKLVLLAKWICSFLHTFTNFNKSCLAMLSSILVFNNNNKKSKKKLVTPLFYFIFCYFTSLFFMIKMYAKKIIEQFLFPRLKLRTHHFLKYKTMGGNKVRRLWGYQTAATGRDRPRLLIIIMERIKSNHKNS